MTHAHLHEPHRAPGTSRLNWLRAGILGANDGIVSIALILSGMIVADSSRKATLTVGAVAVTAGAISTALGEYVSVPAQRDTERALTVKEKVEFKDSPDEEHNELVETLPGYGIPRHTIEDAAHSIA